ncbi:MAG TPA: hypothetical protein DCY20_06760 [Firmicutes bacterium]|nr:hypothetical protein [Bacillota bacterium]
MWTLDDVELMVNELEKQSGVPLFNLKISLTSRMKQVLATCRHTLKYTTRAMSLMEEFPDAQTLNDLGLTYEEAVEFENYDLRFSTRVLMYASYEQLKEVVIHEYAHYLCLLLHDDGTHGKQFKEYVTLLGGKITHADYAIHADPDNPLVITQTYYSIECCGCHEVTRYVIRTPRYKEVLSGDHRYMCAECESKQLKAYEEVVTEPY